jgi:hypothetical protein
MGTTCEHGVKRWVCRECKRLVGAAGKKVLEMLKEKQHRGREREVNLHKHAPARERG